MVEKKVVLKAVKWDDSWVVMMVGCLVVLTGNGSVVWKAALMVE